MQKIQKLVTLMLLLGQLKAIEPNPPVWDTSKVKIFAPGDSSAQNIINQIVAEMGGHEPQFHGQFSDSRYALLFKPGQHDLNVDIGYYTTVHGLGKTPTDTIIGNVIVQNGAWDMVGGALSNFWRSAENFSTKKAPGDKMIWAVSQASPLRRVQVDGDLEIYQYNPPFPGAGYASGGFMSDVRVSGNINSGSQQQFMIRNSEMSSFPQGVWNMVFSGSKGAPADHCSIEGKNPYTNVASSPMVVEKPYLVLDGDSFKLMVPRLELNKVGVTPNFDNADPIDFSQVYVASASDSASTINSKLAEGLHLVLQPGQYRLEAPIRIEKANTVVFGMGLATLIPTTGKAAIEVANVDGVKISGLLLQAGTVQSPALIQLGDSKNAGNPQNPSVIQDVYARVGGPDRVEVSADIMMVVNTGYTIIDNTWLWRADHDVSGDLVKNGKNPCSTGLQVNGDNVITYGLAAEHTLKDLVEWNGENGQVIFYQSEYPYDVDQSYGDAGYAAFRVGDNVQNFAGYGMGAYSFFRDNTVWMDEGIKVPKNTGVSLKNSLAVFLNGNGGIKHVVDDEGTSVQNGTQVSYDCNFVGTKPSSPFETTTVLI